MRCRAGGRAGWFRAWALLVGSAALVPATARGQVWEVGNRALSAVNDQASAFYGAEAASGDFNGDGYPDLAVSAPFHDFDASHQNSGLVHLYLGGPSGIAATPFHTLTGGVAGMRLGAALAAGRFDSDAADELAISAPGMDVGGQDEAGRVYIYNYGEGLTFVEQGGTIQGAPEPFDHFGEALAVGDFDDDSFYDLAIGVPGENIEDPAPTVLDAGVVQVLFGSASGLDGTGDQYVTQSVLGGVQANARFGKALAAGDFNEDDTFYDLAIGVPERDVAGVANAGQIVIVRGSASGLVATNHQVIDQTFFGLTHQADDNFGWSLAAGDFNRTSTCWNSITCKTDLAIGIPFKDVASQANAGMIVAAYGSSTGLTAAGAQILDQGDLSDFASGPEAGDNFGATLASDWYYSARLNGRSGSGSADHLVVGANNEDWLSVVDAGIVHLVFGGASGLQSELGQFRLIEDGLAAAPQQADARFGSSVAIDDFDADGHADLAIGIVEQDVAGLTDAGALQILYGALHAEGFERGSFATWTTVVP